MRRLFELAKADDPADPESAQASAEALAALRRALELSLQRGRRF
jgi:hypothetical protein